MGWVNYIIIPKLKLLVETKREVRELDEYIKEALDNAINFDVRDIELSGLRLNEITVSELVLLAQAFEIIRSFEMMDIDLEKYQEDGFMIIKRWE